MVSTVHCFVGNMTAGSFVSLVVILAVFVALVRHVAFHLFYHMMSGQNACFIGRKILGTMPQMTKPGNDARKLGPEMLNLLYY